MTVKLLDKRVITDKTYWNIFQQINKKESIRLYENIFVVTKKSDDDFKEMVEWCKTNTVDLIYFDISFDTMSPFGISHSEDMISYIYFASQEDALKFKLVFG